MIAIALLATLLLTTPAGASSAPLETGDAPTAQLISLTKKDIGSRRFHAALAIEPSGALTGILMTGSGKERCRFRGLSRDGCLYLGGCAGGVNVCSFTGVRND